MDYGLEKNVIEIYNPSDFPYGALSNNFSSFMNINGKRYQTVTNFILSSVMVVPIYKVILQQAPIKGRGGKLDEKIESAIKTIIETKEKVEKRRLNREEKRKIKNSFLNDLNVQNMDIYQLYNYYLYQEELSTLRSAVEKGYNALVSKNFELMQILIETENVPIHFISSNPILGMGEDGDGHNIIGNVLMQIRNNLQNQQKEHLQKIRKDEYVKNVFETYIAYQILDKELEKGKDLSEYIGKSPREIIEGDIENINLANVQTKKGESSIRYFGNTTVEIVNDKMVINYDMQKAETVTFVINNGGNPTVKKAVDNSLSEKPIKDYLVLLMRSTGLRKIKEVRSDLIFEIYVTDLIRKEYPQLTDREIQIAIAQLVSTAPSLEVYINTRNEVVKLYNKGKLPQDLLDAIKQRLQNIDSPTTKEIEKAEAIEEKEPSKSSSTSSSSSSDENPIKKAFTSEKDERRELTEQLSYKSGKSKHHYKKYTLEQLRAKVDKKQEDKKGAWRIYVNINGKKELIDTTPKAPTQNDILQYVTKYNTEKGTTLITSSNIEVIWLKGNIDGDKKVRFNLPDMEEDLVYIQPYGAPLQIYYELDRNEDKFSRFSPFFISDLIIDNLFYPSLSMYFVASMLTLTGIQAKSSLSGEVSYSRGRNMPDARKLLIADDKKDKIEFVNNEVGEEIYIKEKDVTFKSIFYNTCSIALTKKFSNMNLLDLLATTKNSILLWKDPNDNFLGAGTEKNPGENIAGKLLMGIRDNYLEWRKQNPYPVIKKSYTIVKKDEKTERVEIFDPKHIKDLYLNDTFFASWIKMRLMDMCTTVYRFKQYYDKLKNSKSEMGIDFVKIILQILYGKCDRAMEQESMNETPPQGWLQIVKGCKGIELQMERNYNEEIKELENRLINNQLIFLGLPIMDTSSKTSENIQELLKRHEEIIKKKKEDNASEKEIKEELKRQRKEIENFEKILIQKSKAYADREEAKYRELDELESKKEELSPQEYIGKKYEIEQKYKKEAPKENIHERQRKEWSEKMEELLKPELSEEEIKKRYNEYLQKLLVELKAETGIEMTGKIGEKIPKRTVEKIELEKKLAKRMKDYLKRLATPALSKEEIAKQMKKLEQKQEEDLLKFYGKQGIKRTPEEIKMFDIEQENIVKQIQELNKQKIEVILYHRSNIANMAELYWNKIANLMYYVFNKLNSDNNMSGHMLKEVIIKAVQLNSEPQNCKDVVPSLSVEENCIGSAIINLLFSIQKFKEYKEMKKEFLREDIDLAVSIILDNDFIKSKEYIEEEDSENVDEIADELEISEISDGAEFFSFSMNKIKDPVKEATKTIHEVYGLLPDKNFVIYFLSAIKTIKEYKMSEKVKNNRINFYASF